MTVHSIKFLMVFNLPQWQAGMNVRASAMLPSLKILAVKVRFSHDMEVKMLDTLLRCFPRLETLHVMVVPMSYRYLFVPILVYLL